MRLINRAVIDVIRAYIFNNKSYRYLLGLLYVDDSFHYIRHIEHSDDMSAVDKISGKALEYKDIGHPRPR